MNYSIYVSAFNLIDNLFDYDYHLRNFCNFTEDGGEVVVCVNSSKDDTENVLKSYIKEFSHLKIIKSDFSYENPNLDGLIKNAALQATSYPIKISMDFDEIIPLNQKDGFDSICQYFLNSNYQAVMLPVINLYKSRATFKDIGFKWRIHKGGLFRGVVNFAKLPGGLHDITLSDGCELIDKDGNLVSSAYLIDPTLDDDKKLWEIKKNNIPFVWHYGLLDLEIKSARNKNFWKNHWEVESGREVEVELSPADFENKGFEAKEHGLEF